MWHFLLPYGEILLNTFSNLGVTYWKRLSSLIFITELCPVLGFALTSLLFCRLTQMWRTMHESHKAQALISQQLSSLSDNHNTLLNSEYHHQATIQFETEASYWYNSFCKLVKSQREYVSTLYQWLCLTDRLRDGLECSDHSSILSFCQQWQSGLDGLPDKVLSVKNLMPIFFPSALFILITGKGRNSFVRTVLSSFTSSQHWKIPMCHV